VFVSSKNPEKILRIEPEQYFTKIPFIPNPDGSFYDIGFGVLIGSINRASNTILNMLLDAGTLANRQSGFLAKGIRVKGGDTRFKPGEWKVVEALAADLKNGIVPLPTKEPSTVLYNLLVFLIEAGNKLGSTVDMMVGENPGQNQPATTTMAVLEQGLKVFIAIHKRQFRALKNEYKKLYKLNAKYFSEMKDEYLEFINPMQEHEQEALEDYNGPADDVRPNADTSVITEAQRITKAQALLQLLPLGLNVEAVKKRNLEAQKQENIQELLAPNPPGPADPKIELMAQKQKSDVLLRAAELVLSHMSEESLANLNMTGALKNLADARLKTAQANVADRGATLSEIETHLEIFKATQEREEQEEEQEVAQQLGGADGGGAQQQ
jgi:chaperonin GroES